MSGKGSGSMIDKEKIAYHVRGILEALGEDPARAGLIETPDRVARMYEDVFAGIQYSNAEIAQMYAKTFETERSDLVIESDISLFSYCEHHMALMYDMTAAVGYYPHGRVLGLSKIARICEMAAKRLQLQERLGADIAEIVSLAAGTPDVAVVINGSHSCMTARGIKSPNAKTLTVVYRGAFELQEGKREEFLRALALQQGKCI